MEDNKVIDGVKVTKEVLDKKDNTYVRLIDRTIWATSRPLQIIDGKILLHVFDEDMNRTEVTRLVEVDDVVGTSDDIDNLFHDELILSFHQVRNWSTDRLHTDMSDIRRTAAKLLQDPSGDVSDSGAELTYTKIREHLKRYVKDKRFWQDKYDSSHCGNIVIPFIKR